MIMITAIDAPKTLPILSSYKESIFFEGDTYFRALLEDIREAKYKIDLESYIFSNDELGRKIADALADAAQRGVKIRVLVDGAGTSLWRGRIARRLEKAGIQFRVFHPFPWQLWNWSRSAIKSPWLLRWIYFFLNGNVRNHRKVCMVDQYIAYIASINICKKHLNKSAG